MPRFQQSRKFKGFAFVEFAAKDSTEKALKAAAASDPTLNGVRAMSKIRWLEIKEMLKAKLNEEANVAESMSHSPNPAVSSSKTLAAPDTASEQENAQIQHGRDTTAIQSKKRSPGPTKRHSHIHFDTGDGESGSDDDNIRDVKKLKLN